MSIDISINNSKSVPYYEISARNNKFEGVDAKIFILRDVY